MAGDILQGFAQIQSGNDQLEAGLYNASLARQKAAEVREQTRQEAEVASIQGGKFLGAQRAATGASGITGEGSAMDVLEESAMNIQKDIYNIKLAGERAATDYINQGASYERAGRTAKKTGTIMGAASFANGGTKAATLLLK